MPMAIHRMVVHEGDQPPAEALAEVERAAKMPINYEDAPALTDKELAYLSMIARARKASKGSISEEVQRAKARKETEWDYISLAMEFKKQRADAENRFAKLILMLMHSGRTKDVERAAEDAAYRKKIFEEFHLNGE